jgi:hypothetical protein
MPFGMEFPDIDVWLPWIFTFTHLFSCAKGRATRHFVPSGSQLHGQTAVDLNHRTGNIRGRIRKQESGDWRYFVHPAESPQRN